MDCERVDVLIDVSDPSADTRAKVREMPPSLLLRSLIVQHNYWIGVSHPFSRREV
jgi:hypothetical protein